MAVATPKQAGQLKIIAQQEGGLPGAEIRILNLRQLGFGPKVIQRKTEYPQWFIDKVLNIL